MKVLLAVPDDAIAQSLDLMLRSSGFNPFTVDTADEAAELARLYAYECIVLSDVLVDARGLDAVRRLRAAKIAAPIILLARAVGVDPEVEALDAGADDYQRLPFHRGVFPSRLRAVIRRSQGHAEDVIQIGSIAVDIGAKGVRVDGRPLHLTGKEYGVMEALALRKGLVLSKEALLNQLYGGMDEPELKIIDVFICKIRNKLRPLGAHRHLETVWGRGYRLVEAPETPPEIQVITERRSPAQEAVLGAVAVHARAFEDIRRAIPWVARGTIYSALATLVARGAIERLGVTRSATYRLVQRAASAA